MLLSAVLVPHSVWRFGYWQSAGLAHLPHAVYLLGVFVLVAVLLWRRHPSHPYLRFGVVALALACVHTFIATRKVGESVGWQVVALATLPWLLGWCWLAWSTAWPSRRVGLAVCALFVLLGIPGLRLLRVEGFEGDGRLGVFWNSPTTVGRRTGAAAEPAAHVAADFPQFMGPNRDGFVEGDTLAIDWSKTPPREIWRREVGAGWGAFVVQDDVAYTMERRGDEECVVAYGLQDGQPRWVAGIPTDFAGSAGGNGVRSTPCIQRDQLWALGTAGRLRCLRVRDGGEVWSEQIIDERENLIHGVASSPLIVEPLLYVSPTTPGGPCLTAMDLRTGETIWKTGSNRASYASPCFAVLHDTPQILVYDCQGLGGYDAAVGTPLWHFAWSNASSTNAAQPVVFEAEHRVFITCAFGQGGAMIVLERGADGTWTARSAWTSNRMKCKFSSPLPWRQAIVGLDNGILAAIDIQDGSLVWKSGRYGHGQLLRVGQQLLVLSEKGELNLLDWADERPVTRGSVHVLSGKTWNHLALATPFLVVRNAHEAACYELPLAADRDEKP